MTDTDLKALMDSTGLYYDPEHPDYIEDSKLRALELPFMEFTLEEESFFADDVCYWIRERLRIRVFTDTATKSAEKNVSDVLTSAGLAYRVEREFLPELAIWQTTFTTEV